MFLLIQTLPTFWAERIWILRFCSFDLLDPKFLDFQVPRSPNFRISRSQIPRFPDFQTPLALAPPDELSDPNLTPLPTHPWIKCVAKNPCFTSSKWKAPRAGSALHGRVVVLSWNLSNSGQVAASLAKILVRFKTTHPKHLKLRTLGTSIWNIWDFWQMPNLFIKPLS